MMVLSALLLTSCSLKTYYQVYELRSDDVRKTTSNLQYENDDCMITYNMWSKGGNASFLITNKTDRNLFVVMPKSFFILNGVANDYYSESVYGSSVTAASGASVSTSATVGAYLTDSRYWYPITISRGYSESSGVAVTKSVETKETALVCVPPRAAKFIRGFNIYDDVYKKCGDAKHNYPKTTSDIIRYNENNTPISFRNRIAYAFDEQLTDIKYIDHHFWMASVQNFSEKAALNKERVEDCETSATSKQAFFNMSGPDKFYNDYDQNRNAENKETESPQPSKKKSKKGIMGLIKN